MVHNLFSRVFVVNFHEKLRYFKRFYSSKSYKILFFGSESIALKSLRKINEFRKQEKIIERLDLVTANTSKNKTVIEKYAQEENIRTIPWPLQQLQDAEYDVGLIVAFGHLITKDVLNKFPLGMINVHPSLLPRWRGAAPIIHTLLHGDTVTGVTLMKIKPDIFDVGEIIGQQRVPVSNDIKLPELTEQLSDIGADMLVECLRSLPTCLENAVPQSEEGVTYAKKIDKSISDIRWSQMDAHQVYNLHRALYDLYPLTTKFKDKTIKLFDAFLDTADTTDDIDNSKPVGTLEYCERTNAIRILCKDKKYVHFKSLRIVGKRKITALDFYNGYVKNVPKEKRQYVVC